MSLRWSKLKDRAVSVDSSDRLIKGLLIKRVC